ncbi:hypothetical protein QAD02_014180 [Eretmocerus hayati]|uniref:Uncharacterized protein n=1 Tax=Eretmocerus hayati TaxID=131215 RepID=A0ACC2P5K9_9HYME|nr:hypothetical protein QAD02_014180 [Eretmocerus hayati]
MCLHAYAMGLSVRGSRSFISQRYVDYDFANTDSLSPPIQCPPHVLKELATDYLELLPLEGKITILYEESSSWTESDTDINKRANAGGCYHNAWIWIRTFAVYAGL